MSRIRLAAVSVARSDFGRMLPVYRRLDRDEGCDLKLYVAGNHGLSMFGRTSSEIITSGLANVVVLRSQVDEGSWQVASRLVNELAEELRSDPPDYLLIMGDRFEMLACAMAAMLVGVAIVHIGGGHLTEGAFDDSIRHSLTHMAYHHLVPHSHAAEIVAQLGEDEASISVTGAPDVIAMQAPPEMSRRELLDSVGMHADADFLLVTLHPETRLPRPVQEANAATFFKALREAALPSIVTAPCADPGADLIFREIEGLVAERSDSRFVPALGAVRYVQALREAAVVVGNSSSGLIEAPSVPVPVVNVGNRQRGRVMAPNVLQADWSGTSIESSISKAMSPAFRRSIAGTVNPYGTGDVCAAITASILALPSTPRLDKVFVERRGAG